MGKFAKDALTGKDCVTYDAARILGVCGAASYVIFWIAAVFHIHGATFTATDAAAYGAGLGTVILSMGAALKIKESTEP